MDFYWEGRSSCSSTPTLARGGGRCSSASNTTTAAPSPVPQDGIGGTRATTPSTAMSFYPPIDERRTVSPFLRKEPLEERGDPGWHLPSIFAQNPADLNSMLKVSEDCKFHAGEQENLLKLRKRLVAFAKTFEDLRQISKDRSIQGEVVAKSPELRHSLENVFANEQLLDRTRSYIAFIDAALAGKLDPGPRVKPRTRGPAQPSKQTQPEPQSLLGSPSRTPRLSPFQA
mmetsp:Transcript_63873/g.138864  ORF Transcript_63873/g.138864 Transcript_63873/m.138864 type:complete len:229 (-) Transcript_63873:399-1085(-)